MREELAKMFENPTHETVAAFLKASNMDADRVKKLLKPCKRTVNKNLTTRNHFATYSEAVNFVYDSVKAGGFIMPEVFWPSLETEQNIRVQVELDKSTYLVVCLYKFKSGTIECVAYVS